MIRTNKPPKGKLELELPSDTKELVMNQVETTIYKYLSARQRVNRETNVTRLSSMITHTNPDLSEDAVLGFFRKLQDEGKGSLIIGRKDNPTRFLWDYNLKEVALKALGEPVKEVKAITKPQKKRGPKPGSKRLKAKSTSETTKPTEVVPVVTLNFELKGANPKDIQALIELANGLKK